MQAMAWVLGEYGYLSQQASKEVIMEKLCNLAHQTKDHSTRSDWIVRCRLSSFLSFIFSGRAHVISALMKLVAQNGSCPVKVTELIALYSNSSSLDVRQRFVDLY